MEAILTTNYEGLSMIKRLALEFLDNLKIKIINNDCDDSEIMEAMTKYHPSVNKEYYNPNDYCNYDEACKILHLSANRAKLRSLCDEYGIECVYIKNRPLGFPKKDIERLAEIQSEEVKKREMKEKKKKGQRKFLW
jgi:vacuolar-type H+-ATPase subunit I/STV1